MDAGRLWILVAACLLAARPVTAEITGISVQPNEPYANFAATITVTGTNPCGAIQVNYGSLDQGLPPTVIVHPIISLPWKLKQTWKSVGPRHIVVKGEGNCTGQASLDIKVVPYGRKAPDTTHPTITGIIGTSTPGGVAAITGSGFGNTPGKVQAHLLTWNIQPRHVFLEVGSWKNGLIEVHWPTDISNVTAQDATIDVTTSTNHTSPNHLITFVPELVAKLLPPKDVTLMRCGNDSNVDDCNGVVDPDDDGFTWPECSSDSSFCASHYNVWGAIGDDSDEDRYDILLKNDWFLDHMEFTYKDQSGGTLSGPSGFVPNSQHWSAKIAWTVTPNDDVGYSIAVWIVGPKGVPDKRASTGDRHDREIVPRRSGPGAAGDSVDSVRARLATTCPAAAGCRKTEGPAAHAGAAATQDRAAGRHRDGEARGGQGSGGAPAGVSRHVREREGGEARRREPAGSRGDREALPGTVGVLGSRRSISQPQ